MSTPQQPKNGSKSNWWKVLGVAALVALCVAAAVLKRDGTGASGSSGHGVAPGGKMGTAVRDGKFEFVVHSIQCGVGRIGPDQAHVRAHGQFCLVSLSVKNIGDQARSLSEIAQKGVGSNGSQYRINSTAGLYANDSNRVWRAEINPGNEITGTIVYDLPEDVQLARLELHDSMTSGGVKVELR